MTAAKQAPTIMEQAVTRLLSEADSDTDRIATQLLGGDLRADVVDVPKAKYNEYRAENWDDPKKRAEWAQSMEPRAWFEEALKIISPDLSARTTKRYLDMLEAGVPADEAGKVAQDMHNAEQMILHAKDPVPLYPSREQAAMRDAGFSQDEVGRVGAMIAPPMAPPVLPPPPPMQAAPFAPPPPAPVPFAAPPAAPGVV